MPEGKTLKLIELEIENVRGITHIQLSPNSKNFVIWGPNGSGKSAIVDAIDFLLTGRISRLMGEGTRSITLNECGPHIDHEPKEAVVRAVIKVPGITEPIEIKRSMDQPNKLEYENKMKSHLEPITSLAHRGEHVLTRRDILKYITSDGSTRAREIQALLNITDIDKIRKAFVKVENDLKKEKLAKEQAINTSKGAVNATIQESTFQERVVLEAINKARKNLGGKEISSISSKNLKSDLSSPLTISKDKAVDITLFERDIQNLKKILEEKSQNDIQKNDKQLREIITSIHSKPELLNAFNRNQLIELGISMIDGTGNCPLCDTTWAVGKLQEHLEKKLSDIETISQYKETILKLSKSISERVNTTDGSLSNVIDVLGKIGEDYWIKQLALWSGNLNKLSTALNNAFDGYPLSVFTMSEVKKLLVPDEITDKLDSFVEIVKKKAPSVTPEQTAWDLLTRLEENLKALEKADTEFIISNTAYKKAAILLHEFENARDTVLGRLYDEVKERFVNLYKELHGTDEMNFSATIAPDGAALNFEVNFYDRGNFPPHALHSEGHQDSMGLYLYLALSERLAKGLIDLIILDDVVMSVDSSHRRSICRILASSFPDRQFLITTHDKTWANQMRSEGVIDRNGLIEFYNWNVDTGPQVNYQADMWTKIEEDLEKNDVPSAAARLRRGLEEYFGLVCDSLHIPVRYKLNGQLDLGDFISPLMDRYRDIIKKGRNSASSWGNIEVKEKFDELDSIRKEIYTRTHAEQWGINPNVHYNNWIFFSENDFRPIKEAFQDFCNLFVCGSCGGTFKLTTVGMKTAGVACNCGSINWNLIPKSRG
ncbi:MAG: DNA replication and repair protein RecF [Candidatus Argoarchaeum ethanivorans]|uniref:DNA replication and repair protein RecF n=1 Tax=Candidatus Argoarchaeum ethanivorans TaxID=2608793 RepID=A0A811T809_9EURY|nr:MAG: DNA replication and repair protein RecF [Candidatus Argoarchaeum ethanivorans]